MNAVHLVTLLAAVTALAPACDGDDDDVRADGSPSTGGAYGTGTGGTKSDAGEAGERNSGAKAGTGGAAGDRGGSASNPAGAAGEGGNASGDSGGSSSAGEIGPAYANVVEVATSGNDGAYTFNVSIESSDIDCTQFANWWEVLGEDGTLRYRRILEHSHTDENGASDSGKPGNTFTRSGGPIAIDADEVVIVRAHPSTGGYNGVVMRGSAADGFATALDIGADFAAGVEAEAPQPGSCAF